MSLFDAIASGDEDALRAELERDPETAAERDADGLSPVLYALYNGHAELVDPILDANPALDVFDAAAVGRTRGLEELLEAEPELAQAWSPDGFTALHLAAYFGHEDAAKLLLECGAEPRVISRHAEITVAPAQSAAAGGNESIVKLLLEHGAELEDIDPELRAHYVET